MKLLEWLMNPIHSLCFGWAMGTVTGYLLYGVTHFRRDVR